MACAARSLCLAFALIIVLGQFAVAEPAEFRIRINRKSVSDGLITGSLSLNGKDIGTVYENAYLKIPSGTYKGVMRYVSEKGHALSPGGVLAEEGDFLLEVSNVKESDGRKRENILFHGGNKAKHSRGCILMGPVQRDPVTKQKYVGETDLLRILRRQFYGAEAPNASPNVRIVIEIVDAGGA